MIKSSNVNAVASFRRAEVAEIPKTPQKPKANGRLEVVNFDKFLARLQVSPFAP
jgi:hypothetical protein